MKKITIIEQAYQPIVSLDLLKGEGYEKGDGGKDAQRVVDRLEIELAIKKLKPKQQEIVRLIGEGYSHREIAKMIGVGKVTVRRTLDKVRDILK
jgi:RNA polymerase sigma factor (sigma-70 family)